MNKTAISQCATAVSLFRGLYARVARNLKVDVSYVSRIARGERQSGMAERAIAEEFNRVRALMKSGLARPGKKNRFSRNSLSGRRNVK